MRGAPLICQLLLGCGDGEMDRPLSGSPVKWDPDAVVRGTSEADPLFDIDHVPVFRFTLPEAEWAALQATALDERYTDAVLEFEGQRIGTVGLRFKGNYSTLDSCIDANGQLTCAKLSMKIGFAEYEPKLRFFGLKRLNLQSYVYDDSKIHEPLAYSLYRDMGIRAPRAAWANVFVNGESYGLFGMVEEVDGHFTDENWPGNGNGQRYKEAWPSSTDPDYYAERLDSDAAGVDHHTVLELAEALARAKPEGRHAVAQVLERRISLDYLRHYFAVDEAILNIDGISSIYTSPEQGWTNNHNFYLYQEEDRDVFWPVPWDLDSTFWINTGKNSVPPWTETPNDCSRVYPVFNGAAWVLAPGCDAVFQAVAADRVAFARAVDRLLEGPFEPSKVADRVDRMAAFVESSIAADPKLDPSTKLEWFHSSVGELKRNVRVLGERVRALSRGERIANFQLEVPGPSDFESSRALDAMLGVPAYSNPASLPSVSIVTNEVTGHALQLAVSFRDEAEPWKQYAVYHVPIANAPVDFSGFRGVRFRARASRPGSGRVELVSAIREEMRNYRYEGWRIVFETAWSNYEFVFADARLPSYATDQDRLPFEDVIQGLVHLRFQIDCAGRNTDGQLGTASNGTPRTDDASVEIDDVEFLTD